MFEQKLIEELKIIISRMIWKKIIFIIFILGILIGAGAYYIYNSIRGDVIRLIASQFEKEDIKDLIDEVASSEAKDILKEGILPEIANIKKDVLRETSSFKDTLEDYKIKFRDEYKTFDAEIIFLKKLNMLKKLSDKAVADGNRDSFKALQQIIDSFPEPDLMSAAKSELRNVKAFYENKSAAKGVPISHFGSDGKQVKDADMATHYLIFALRNDGDWKIRARAANLLGDRKEKGVPEILLDAAEKDISLDVLKACLLSFEKITGYEGSEVFGYEQARDWWAKNDRKINEKLSELSEKIR
ncbi:MAG: hypothetical protein ABIG92_07585 [Candidatus Omnitrophota bacterium]